VALHKTAAGRRIDLTLGVRRLQPLPDLSKLDLQLPKQRHYLSRSDLEHKHGADPAALKRIRDFAAAHQLTVTHEDVISARIGLSGTVAQLSAAFGVTLFDYEHPELGSFHARTGQISLPSEVANDITGVFGFNNHRALRRRPRQAPSQPVDAKKSQAHAWFLPTELVGLYNFPAADLSQQTIGLLEFGGGVVHSDLSSFCQHTGVKPPALSIVALPGVTPNAAADPDSTGEVMLDIEVVAAMAPGAKIVTYFSTFDEKGLIDALSAVIEDKTHNPDVISISWGWDENQPFSNGILWSPAAISHVNESFLAAAQLGISICVSTGDDGSEAQVKDGQAHVNFPATSPYVLAVGGTTLHALPQAGGGTQLNEVVWNDGPGSGTGGGISDITPVPAWQEGVVPKSINTGHFAGRGIPDVAANADPNTGYWVFSGGKPTIVGGTSAAAPLWACLIARLNVNLNAKLGNFNALLYTQIGPKGVLRDITSGNNDTDGLLDGRFAAGPGWDACTGWGSPDGVKLLQALK